MSEQVNRLTEAIPAGTIEVPSEGERYHAVSHRDWRSLRTKVERLRQHERQYAAVGWTALGISVSAALAALAWFPTYATLQEDDRLAFAWIGPAMLGLTALGLVVACLMAWVARANRHDLSVAVDDLLADIDQMPRVSST